jgi:hypothetical protein
MIYLFSLLRSELCQIKKDFLSGFVKIVADFVARVEAANMACTMNDLVTDITIPGLQNLCSSTLDGIEQGY